MGSLIASPYQPRSVLMLLLSVSLLPLVGCGPAGPKTVPVSGTVTLNGQPVPHLVVHFMPDEGRPSWGYTDEQGRFTLNYTRDRDGAELGKHKVWFVYEPKAQDAGQEMEWMKSGPPRASEELAAALQKYGSDSASPLTLDVQQSESDLQLKLD
ncbi:MAG: hypothetical protein KDA59_08805 [Planctomycetales bacterium]|nr:hypothetical protein [Planctomycetales bacterium]